jgi:hypothetical protein
VALLKNEELIRIIGENNRRKIREKYSLDFLEKQMRSIYTKILALE